MIDRPFIATITGAGPTPVSVQSARRTTAIMLAAIESIKTRRIMDLTAEPFAAAMTI